MSILHNSIKRSVVKVYHEEDTDLLGNICRSSLDCDTGGEVIAGPNMEAEKRIRREIANSNERRRMQSINAGFQSLRTLLPHHEGEKLSKAAILQQTAEYIYNLEQEKTRLLSQNCQLMRQVQQHEGDVPPKKRIKAEMIMPSSMNIVASGVGTESSDEGLGGSMSPEPIVAAFTAPTIATTTKINNEMAELRRQLDRERSVRIHLEEQIRTMESQLYQQMEQMQQQCIYEEQQHADVVVADADDIDNDKMRESIVTTVIQEATATATAVTNEEEDEEDSNSNNIEMQLVQPENVPLVGQTETVVCCSPQLLSRSSSPLPLEVKEEFPPPRLPSVLEAAIKAEPKVEVERLPSPAAANHSPHDDVSCNSRLYVANTSRQNLETIVEAIRHLEGDHLFSDEPTIKLEPTKTAIAAKILQPQDAPLALTTTTKCGKLAVVAAAAAAEQRLKVERSVKVEMKQYFHYHTHHHQQQQQQQHQQQQQQHHQQHQQQSRPGVIVVKQHS